MARKRKQKSITLVPDKVKKPSGLKADGTPNLHWQKFEERLKSIDTVPLENWKEEEALGYLLKKYKEHYKIDFALSYSGAPGKSGEMYCVRRIFTAIGTQKAWIVKNYIDWVFEKIITPQNVPVKSLAYFFTHSLCEQYRTIFRKRLVITRTTELPPDYLAVINKLNIRCQTYGDLAFIKLSVDQNPDSPYRNLFDELNEVGFDSNILQTLGN